MFFYLNYFHYYQFIKKTTWCLFLVFKVFFLIFSCFIYIFISFCIHKVNHLLSFSFVSSQLPVNCFILSTNFFQSNFSIYFQTNFIFQKTFFNLFFFTGKCILISYSQTKLDYLIHSHIPAFLSETSLYQLFLTIFVKFFRNKIKKTTTLSLLFFSKSFFKWTPKYRSFLGYFKTY